MTTRLPWAKPFRRRCRAILSKAESPCGGARYGRCELAAHSPNVDHALEYGFAGHEIRWRTVVTG
jgi:hypothetical protein